MNLEEIRKYTPALSDDERGILHKFNNILNSINREYNNEFIIDYIYPLDGENICGLNTPHNIQIIKKTHEDKKVIGSYMKGAVTRENLLDNKQLRYKGIFLRGCEEYVKKQILTHGPARKPKHVPLAQGNEEDVFIPLYNDLISKHDTQTNDYFQDAIDLIGKTAHMHTSPVRSELQKWCHQFGSYYTAKYANKDDDEKRDSNITINLTTDED